MRRLTDRDLIGIIGSMIEGYRIEAARVKRGTFLICGISGDNFASLSDAQLHQYAEVYATPEVFLNLGGRIIILRMQEETENENI